MKTSVFSKLGMLLLVSALVLVPFYASAQTQPPDSSDSKAGAAGAAAQGTTGTAAGAGAGAAGGGGSSGLGTAAILGIVAGVALIGALALSGGGGGGGDGGTTSGHTTAGHTNGRIIPVERSGHAFIFLQTTLVQSRQSHTRSPSIPQCGMQDRCKETRGCVSARDKSFALSSCFIFLFTILLFILKNSPRDLTCSQGTSDQYPSTRVEVSMIKRGLLLGAAILFVFCFPPQCFAQQGTGSKGVTMPSQLRQAVDRGLVSPQQAQAWMQALEKGEMTAETINESLRQLEAKGGLGSLTREEIETGKKLLDQKPTETAERRSERGAKA